MDLDIQKVFPFVDLLTPNEKSLLVYSEVRNGQTVLLDGDHCDHAAFVYNGELKVVKTSQNGREINLYRVVTGEVCILTITSSLSHQPYSAQAVAVKDTKLFLIPKDVLKTWISINPLLQELVYKFTAERFINMMTLFDALLFKKMDERIIEFLLFKLPQNDDILLITHDEIAAELGTVREVISRVMKSLEKLGYIHMSRGKVKMINRDLLERKMTIK